MLSKQKISVTSYSLTVILMMLLPFIGFAQNSKATWSDLYTNKDRNFYEIQKDFNAYWEGKKVTKGSGFKPFKRWEAFMEPRVYPSGNLSLPNQTFANMQQWQRNFGRDMDKSGSRAGNWTELGPIGSPSGPFPYTRTGAGRITFIKFDPNDSNTIYVGTPDGGMWKSTNGGSFWTTNTDFLAIVGCSDLVIDPNNTNVMYLATGDLEGNRRSIGVLKSIDGGATWNTTSLSWNAGDNYKISKLIMNPNDPLNMLVSTDGGVFRTTDGWNTNSNTFCCDVLQDMTFKPSDPNIIYAAGNRIFKSTDNGENWAQVTTGLPSSADVVRYALGVSPANPNYVYALAGKSTNSSMLGVYRSTDSGSSFTARVVSPTINILGYEVDGMDLTSGQAFYDLAIAVSPINPEIVTTGGINHWQSTDGGVTWANKSYWASGEIHADVHELVYLPGSSNVMFSGTDGGVFKSTDNGNLWTDISNNLAIAQVVKLGLSADIETTIVAGEQDNGTNLKTGSNWANIFGGDGGECFIDYTDNNTIYIQYVLGDFNRSDDGGVSTVSISAGLPTDFDFYSTWKMDPVDNLKIYVGGIPTLYMSPDKGDTWMMKGTPPGTGTITDFAIAPSNTDIIYAIKYDAISISIDGGSTFADITGTLPVGSASLSSVTVSDTDPDKVWVTFSGYLAGEKVYKTTNGGTSWTNVSSGLPNLPINTMVYVNGSAVDAVYAGADIGVYYIENNNTTWIPYFNNLPNCAARDLEIFYPTNKLRVGTYGRGVWESDLYNADTDCSYIVTNTNDNGPGSLRRVIECALDGAIIVFDATLTDGIGNDTIKLTSGPIRISKNINIHQTATTIPIIKAVATGPVFNVSGSKLFSLNYVNIYAGTNLDNRAILNNGNLNLENVTIHEKSTVLGTGTTLTNLGNVNIIGNVSILSYP